MKRYLFWLPFMALLHLLAWTSWPAGALAPGLNIYERGPVEIIHPLSNPDTFTRASKRFRLPPHILTNIWLEESSRKLWEGKNRKSGAVGPFQIKHETARDASCKEGSVSFNGTAATVDCVGKILTMFLKICSTLERAVGAYYSGHCRPSPYTKRVMRP